MYKQKIGISLGNAYSLPTTEVIKIVKKVGFDAISPAWKSAEALAEAVKVAREAGLEIQSLHAPFNKAATLWSEGESADSAREELIGVIDAAAEAEIPVVVMHVWIGFEYEFDKEKLNFSNYDWIVSHAAEKDIKIAFENTEGEEYLFALMEHFEGNDTVGFCWDSGHEMCYNYSKDLLAKFGDRLIMTHLNDNLGVSRYDGKTFWTDDLHLLPFDGIADWDYNVRRLAGSRYMPILNFELVIESKPNRHDNDIYAAMPLHLYFTEAYKRACGIAYKYSNR